MARRLGALLCLMAAFGFVAHPALAAVQNVKVGGDIKLIGASRDNFDLTDTRGVNESGASDELDAFVSQARVRIDADLTDNVSTTVRLLNERVWDQTSATAEDDEIDLDLASITLREFLYSPLTLTLGRQELRYGNALILGDPDTNITAGGSSLTTAAAASLGDISLRKAFDAIKAVLDYNPLKIDLIYAKIDENTSLGSGANDDVNLYGVNLNYALDTNNTVLEAYYFGKYTGDGAATINGYSRVNKTEKIHTLGARASTDPIENLNLQGEVAYQFGNYDPALDENAAATGLVAQAGRRRAWAAQVVADYKLNAKYEPRLTGTYSFFSGEDNNRTNGKFNGWNGMFEDQTLGDIGNKIFSPSNAHVLTLTAQAKPLEDLTADITYAYYRLAKKIKSGGNWGASGPEKPTLVLSGLNGGTSYNMVAGKANLGHEVDVHLAYDYTEDVQLGLAAGVFLPGSAFAKPENRDPAGQVIASARVTF